MTKFFGTPDGVKVGDLFGRRVDLQTAHIHPPGMGGIHGNGAEGADSIVLSGGYDDKDYGNYIIYTGHGGREKGSTRHTKDQTPEAPGNAGLITSLVNGFPVRVTRGADKKNPFSPPVGLQYAGLFLVVGWWMAIGRDGYKVVQFRLERISEQAALVTRKEALPDPAYATTTISRRIRDTKLSRELKAIYSNNCQICGTSIPGMGDRHYSEGAHVKPLGRPHLGSDSFNNILCLCPNHHTQLDIGGMVILDDLSVARSIDSRPFGDLAFLDTHQLDLGNAKYHRDHWLQAS